MKKTIHDDHHLIVMPEIYRLQAHTDAVEALRKLERTIRTLDGVGGVSLRYSTTHICSFCGLEWEEFTQDDYDNDPTMAACSLPGDGPGLPACCSKAQDEWRAERAAAAEG